ncbi:MAG: ABC transporter ATP-binding protein [Gemmatales bacterium]|nr:ABC transporter ATP-binding protein [Gemmatales bacterium]MDW7995401.1 ABC transporter ATP-binding protein [Gemmatales bacterium]
MLLELVDVDFAYGSRPALRGVCLRLPEGRIGLLGPNGAGKSTLLRILLGLLRPQRGHGYVLGYPLSDLDYRVRRSIGYMAESDCFVPGLSGVEYVALAGMLYGLPRQEAWRSAHRVLDLLGLEEARYRRLEEYSTGMKQRLKLAQALVHRPRLVLLDEPTSGLDPAGREALLDLLVSLAQELSLSVILSTHILADVERVCEYVVMLQEGRVWAEGTLDQFRRPLAQQYILKVRGAVPSLCQALVRQGVTILQTDGQLPSELGLSALREAGQETQSDDAATLGPETAGGDSFQKKWLKENAGPSASTLHNLRVRVPEGWLPRRFFELAQAHDCIVHQVTPDTSLSWWAVLPRE